MNDGYISLPGLPYQQKGQYGFHQEVDEAGDTGKPGSFWGREHTHKTRLACLHSKINGVVEAEIVKEEKGRLLLRWSPLDKGSTVIKKGKRKRETQSLMQFSLMENCKEPSWVVCLVIENMLTWPTRWFLCAESVSDICLVLKWFVVVFFMIRRQWMDDSLSALCQDTEMQRWPNVIFYIHSPVWGWSHLWHWTSGCTLSKKHIWCAMLKFREERCSLAASAQWLYSLGWSLLS